MRGAPEDIELDELNERGRREKGEGRTISQSFLRSGSGRYLQPRQNSIHSSSWPMVGWLAGRLVGCFLGGENRGERQKEREGGEEKEKREKEKEKSLLPIDPQNTMEGQVAPAAAPAAAGGAAGQANNGFSWGNLITRLILFYVMYNYFFSGAG